MCQGGYPCAISRGGDSPACLIRLQAAGVSNRFRLWRPSSPRLAFAGEYGIEWSFPNYSDNHQRYAVMRCTGIRVVLDAEAEFDIARRRMRVHGPMGYPRSVRPSRAGPNQNALAKEISEPLQLPAAVLPPRQ